jgi:hypothetical protein
MDKVEILLKQGNKLRLFQLLYDFGSLMYSNIGWGTQIFNFQGVYYLKIYGRILFITLPNFAYILWFMFKKSCIFY